MSRLDAMMNQYKDSTSSKKKRSSNTFDLKNYFATFLEEGVNSAQRHIRIIEPTETNVSPFTQIKGHKTQIDGKWRTFVCAKHERGEKCPFCEARELLLATGKEEDKKEAIKYSAKQMYVVKVIDRDKPEEGVKFWRFNHNYKNQGVWDKINAANAGLPKGEDPISATAGRDMIITITRDGKASGVTAINYNMSQTPLSEDAEQAAKWMADDRTWSDVYAVKSYQYLEIIVRGGIPVWQKNTDGTEGGGFVDKASQVEGGNGTSADAADSELSTGIAKANGTEGVLNTETPAPTEVATPKVETAPTEEVPQTSTPAPAAKEEEEDDDLPF